MRAHPKLCAAAVLLLLVLGWAGVNSWAWWHLEAGYEAFERDQLENAQCSLENSLRIWPNSFSAHLLAARIDRRKANFAEAEKHLACCKKQRGLTEEVQLEWLLLRALTGDFLEIEAGLLKSISPNNSANSSIFETLAFCYLKEHRLHRARAVLDLWLKEKPDTPSALFLRGWTFRQLHMRDEAYADFKRALELNPTSRIVRLRFADFLLTDKKTREAAELMDGLLAGDGPQGPDFWLTLGILRLQQGKLDEAAKHLEKVLKVQPQHLMALYQRGMLEMQRDELGPAETYLRRAVQEAPGNNLTRYALYQCLQRQPERKQDARRELALYQANKDQERVSQKLLEDLESFPKNPDLLANAAKHFLSRGDVSLAYDFLHRALSAQADHPLANQLLADWTEQQKRNGYPAPRDGGNPAFRDNFAP